MRRKQRVQKATRCVAALVVRALLLTKFMAFAGKRANNGEAPGEEASTAARVLLKKACQGKSATFRLSASRRRLFTIALVSASFTIETALLDSCQRIIYSY